MDVYVTDSRAKSGQDTVDKANVENRKVTGDGSRGSNNGQYIDARRLQAVFLDKTQKQQVLMAALQH